METDAIPLLVVLSSGNIKQMAHFFFLVLIEVLFNLSQKFFSPSTKFFWCMSKSIIVNHSPTTPYFVYYSHIPLSEKEFVV